jgi:antitoxin component YwqK of YwqJK toxin-antitoxin module
MVLLLPLLLTACSDAPRQFAVKDLRGVVRAEVTRVDGKKDGPVRFYEEDGSLRTAGSYRNDRRHGVWTTVDRHGDTLSILQFKDGRKDGIQAYWADNGRLLRVERFSDGVPNGPLYRFFPDGTPRELSWYEDGKAQGPYMEWYKSEVDRAAFIRGAFLNGEREGLWTWAYPNGRPQLQGRYVHGAKTGTWTRWDTSGKVVGRVEKGG